MEIPILEVRGLKKIFPTYRGLFARKEAGRVVAVDGIDLTLFPGKVLALVGESGSGKSTAARAAIRLIQPTEGEILFWNQPLQISDRESLLRFRRQVQMIFQDPYASLNPRKTILEAIGEGLFYHGLVKDRQEAVEKVAALLKQIGLSPDLMSRYPHAFSGGQQQRICIGRAIALSPSLLICDEALSALDVSIRAQILNLLIELKEKMYLGYLFISHDLGVVRQFADEVAIMKSGKIVEQGPVDRIFQDPHSPYTKMLLDAVPKFRKRP